MGERIKKLRLALGKKIGKNISQQEFAMQLGISRGNIAAYEVGKNLPSDAVISLICQIYNVNEEWLRNGTGEMFRIPDRDEQIAEFVGKAQLEEGFKKKLLVVLSKLNESQWELLAEIADRILEEEKEME